MGKLGQASKVFFQRRRTQRTAHRVLREICEAEAKPILGLAIDALDPNSLRTDPSHPDRLLQQFPGASPNLRPALGAFLETSEQNRRKKLFELQRFQDQYKRVQQEVANHENVLDENGQRLEGAELKAALSVARNGLAAIRRQMAAHQWSIACLVSVALIIAMADLYIIFVTQLEYYGGDSVFLALGATAVILALIIIGTFLGGAPIFHWGQSVSGGKQVSSPSKGQIGLWGGSIAFTIVICLLVAFQRGEVFLDANAGWSERLTNLAFTGIGLPFFALIMHLLFEAAVNRYRLLIDVIKNYETALPPARLLEDKLVRVFQGERSSHPYRKQAEKLVKGDFESAKRAAYKDLIRQASIPSEVDRFARLLAGSDAIIASAPVPPAPLAAATGFVSTPAAPTVAPPAAPSSPANAPAPLNFAHSGNAASKNGVAGGNGGNP